MSRWSRFSQDPFSFVDNLHLYVKGKDLNVFCKFKHIQKMALYLSVAFLILWIIMGFDSSPLQLFIPLYDTLPGVLAGVKPWSALATSYNYYYGKEMHASAFVIYLALWFFISRNYEKAGIVKTKNVVYSSAVMFVAISVFEWFWILSFGTFQVQPWVYTWEFPQLRILIQNLSFLLGGALAMLYVWIDSYKLEGKVILGRNFTFMWKDWKLWVLLLACAASAVFWIYYPGPVQQISVKLDNGQLWSSSRLFPQTLYTVALDPSQNAPGYVNAGVWFYVQNDAVHAVNTIVKLLWAMAVFMAFRVRKIHG